MAALAAMIGASIVISQETWLAQLGHRRDRHAVSETLHAALNWTRTVLQEDRRRSGTDHATELWAQGLPPVDVEGVSLSGRIEDANAYFNLNSLAPNGRADLDAVAAYQRLLKLLGLNEALAHATADWIDSDSEIRTPGGAEDATYLGMSLPRRAANAPLIDLSELKWVRGYTQADIDALRPFVTALPTADAINVNTASAEVLAAATGLPLPRIRQFVASRDSEPVPNSAEISQRLPGPFTSRIKLDVASRYFIVRGIGRKGSTKLGMVALLHRPPDTKIAPRIVWQRLE